jgi:hypothetical protein
MNTQSDRSLSSPQDQKTVRPVALVIALVMMALLLVVAVRRQQPPAPKGVDAPADQFSAGRVQVLLKEILAEGGPHWTGSEQNQGVRQRIISVFERLGYDVDVQEKMVCRHFAGSYTGCAEVQNIITRLPGQEAGPALMLAAHYDSVPAGSGAADDGMAVAGILEMARILKEQGPQRNPIVFLITDAEELGLLGAEGFVSDHPWAQDVSVVLNQETRGNSGRSFMFETSEDNGWLVNAYASSVPQPASSSLHYEIYRLLPNDTDLTIFRDGGIAGLNFAFIGRVAHYHTPLDNIENLNLGSVQHQGESVLAVAQELAGIDLSNPPYGNAAWTDLLGFTVVRWPASWTIPLAVLALLLLLVVAIRLIRHDALTVGDLFLGVLAAFLCLLAAMLAGLLLILIVSLVSGSSAPYYAYPLPIRIAVWAAALLFGGLIATAVARRCGVWGFAVGDWLLWALLALILAILLPGAAIMLLLPTFFAVVLFAVVAFSHLSNSAPAREVTFIAAALGAGAIWLYLSLVFESAVGFAMSPAITLGLGLVAGTLAPLFALPQGRTRVRRWMLIATGVTVILATGIAMLVPPFSASAPQQVALVHFDDRDRGTASMAVSSWPGDPPEQMRDRFAADPVAVFPWIGEPVVVAGVQPSTAPAPDLEVISDDLVSGERIVTAQLRSIRGADSINLHVPVDSLASIVLAGYDFLISPDGSSNGYYTLQCHGAACDGLVLELHLIGETPMKVLITDTTYGLPPSEETLIQSRPITAVPAHQGDQMIIMSRVEL